MLIVGAVIGAGFASGREIISFFGNHISLWIAPACGLGYFIFNSLFLYLGSIVNKSNISEANKAIMGKFHFIADFFLLFNSLIVLSGMLAGMDSLFAEFIPLKPLFSVLSGIVCAFITVKGINGMIKVSNLIVPVIIVSLLALGIINIEFPLTISGDFKVYSLIIYIAMNLMLASGFFITLQEKNKKIILFSSLLSSVILTILMALLILALNNVGEYGDMPTLSLCGSSTALKIIITATIAVSIFTTMLTAMSTLYSWLYATVKSKVFSVTLILTAALTVSFLGFSNVVAYLYPIIGFAGLIYMFCCGFFVLKRSRLSSLFDNLLFNKRHRKIHKRSKNT